MNEEQTQDSTHQETNIRAVRETKSKGGNKNIKNECNRQQRLMRESLNKSKVLK